MFFLSFDRVQFIITICLSLANGVLMCLAAYKLFQIIQLSGYKLKGYFLWLKDTKAKYVTRLIILSFLSLFCVLVTNALFDVYNSSTLYSYLGLIFYFYFSIVFIVNMHNSPKKIPLKATTRMTRLFVALFIFESVLTFFLIALSTKFLSFIKFGIICVSPILITIIVPIVHIILVPFEKLIMQSYVLSAKNKLKKQENLIKIGITGSFGKTSTKYILNTILSQKYSVCISPHSFNTLGGLTRVVNDYLDKSHQVLIAEMGARNVGDIAQLCNLIKPKYGIITGIGSQHLLSFKTLQNIEKTKFELISSLPKDGFAVFNGCNLGATNLYEKCKIEKELTGAKQSKIRATNIDFGEQGTTFILHIGSKKFDCKTALLGNHIVEDILLCVSIALKLGLSCEQIVYAISHLKPISHRLELIKTQETIVLDDAYNASVEGCAEALNVLEKLGKRRVIVTPGLVELGSKEFEENVNFGKKMAKVADIVVIVNNVNFEAIKLGLNGEGFEDQNIYQAETLEKAKLLLKDFVKNGDAILFENDLPDNYI